MFKRLKARHWRAVNPPNAIASATTAVGSSNPPAHSKTRRSTKRREGEAKAKLKDFLEEKPLFNKSLHNRNLWLNLQDDANQATDTPIEWQLSPLQTDVTDKSYRRLTMKAQH